MDANKMTTAKDVSAAMGVSSATAYKIIRKLNEELDKADPLYMPFIYNM